MVNITTQQKSTMSKQLEEARRKLLKMREDIASGKIKGLTQTAPVVKDSQIDISKVQEGKKPIAFPEVVTPETTPQQEYTPMNREAALQQVTSLQAPTGVSAAEQEREAKLREDIANLEQSIASKEERRVTGLEEEGVFEDTQKLLEMKGSLRDVQEKLYAAQDREIEIPIEERQKLRGEQATKSEFEKATRPGLEAVTLETLARSREYSRLGGAIEQYAAAIETNVSIVNARETARFEKEKFVYDSKIKQLETIEKRHSDILSNKQAEALEYRKFQYGLLTDSAKADSTLRNNLLTEAVKKGISPNLLDDSSISSLMNSIAKNNPMAPTNYNMLTPEQVGQLPLDQQKVYWEVKDKKQSFDDEAVAKITRQATMMEQTSGQIETMEEMLGNKLALHNAVGAIRVTETGLPLSGGYRLGLAPAIAIPGLTDFIANAKQMLSSGSLETLIGAKARGATFGALSDREMSIMQNALAALNPDTDEDGNIIGTFNVSPDKFRREVGKLVDARKRLYLMSSISDQYIGLGIQNMTGTQLDKLYTETKANPPTPQNAVPEGQFYQGLMQGEQSVSPIDDTVSFIQNEEGFRPTAYQDQVGQWTIGYGTTKINGQPVRQGDTITQEDADSLFKRQLAGEYSDWKNHIYAPLTPEQQTALYSFEYNLGSNIWNTTGKAIAQAINDGDMQKAVSIMKQHNKGRIEGKLTPLPVLTLRRAREAERLLS